MSNKQNDKTMDEIAERELCEHGHLRDICEECDEAELNAEQEALLRDQEDETLN